MPERIQLSRAKGWRMPGNTVKVDRSTRWGNPFVVSHHHDGWRVTFIDTVYATCETKLEALAIAVDCFDVHCGALGNLEDIGRDAPRELAGKNLACWCPLDQQCHADILLEIANKDTA